MRVLIAEDDVMTCRLLAMAIEKLGEEVTTARDGLEAWEHYKQQPFPVVISDWDMPSLDGLKLCKRIRNWPTQDYPYFIMVTAKSSLDEYNEAMDAGVDDFLAKPLNQKELAIRMRVARRITESREQLRALQAIIPMCSYCKKVRNDQDYWQQVETFLEEELDRGVSHSICPECYEKIIIPQLEAAEKEDQNKAD